MARIKQLPPHEAHKIAAGEVVERPANVVKELIENSLDAAPDAITVHIKKSGKELIRIVDNGHGMNKHDAHLCFKHHATSKIVKVDDLASLETFGFRGEALSSISAVSHTTLHTKEESSSEGLELILKDGVVIKEGPVACTTGTDISIENLFYNVPARKKFLKADTTEWRHILALFQAYALSNHTINFKLFHNESLVHNCPSTDSVFQRAEQLWDRSITANLINLNEHKQNVDAVISGMITHHAYARYDRNSIYFFVNGRWVKNYNLSRALQKGFMNVLQPGRFPAAVIFIECEPSSIDINIHPRKEEVSFLHPLRLELLLQSTVKKTLEENLSEQIDRTINKDHVPFNFDASPLSTSEAVGYTDSTRSTVPSSHPLLTLQHKPSPRAPLSQPLVQQHLEQPEPVDQQVSVTAERTFNVVGQALKTYIVLEHKGGIYLIDQHAAHERILYERFSKKFSNIATVRLLFPAVINVPTKDLALLTPYFPLLRDNGIAIEQMSENQVIITATPVHAKTINMSELVNEFIGFINEEKNLEESALKKRINEKLHAQMACKAAVKAGDELSPEKMHKLIQELYKTDNRFSCPHGRPTGWLLSTHDIEKKFKRKV